METKFGERATTDPSIASLRSEAVANELRELSLQPAHSTLSIEERKKVLQLKLQQRRSREELVNQGIMPPLKSSAAFHDQRRSLERARTEDYLKRKIKSRPEKSELIRMHILEESPAEPLLQAKQLQLKRARLVDNLNDKIAHRPGPMELIHKNILPVHSSIKQAITETQFSKTSGGTSSCDEDSNASLSPGQPASQECPLARGPEASPAETLAGNSLPSPTQVPPPARPLPLLSGSSTSLKLTNGKPAVSVQRTAVHTHVKPKPNSTQKHKKAKDNKPKVKKLKYHQYIPPDQKGDKEPPPHLDSSYAKILQQQQLFLQLQILSQQQQQHYNYPTILPAPPKPQSDQSSSPSSSSSSSSSISPTTSSSPPQAAAAPSTSVSTQQDHNFGNTAALAGTKPTSLPSNLDEMKVAELKCELKLRSLPLSGTKNDLLERLRTYQELNGGSDTTFSPTAGGTTGPGAEGAAASSKSAATTDKNTSPQHKTLCHHTSLHTADATPPAATPKQLMTCGGTVVPPPVSPLTPSNHSPMSPEDGSFSDEPLGGLMTSPLTQLSVEPSSTVQLQANIKEEPTCSAPAPCQFSLKSSSQKKHCTVSSAAHTVASSALAVTIDKDRMLQEKDKQIEELTRMLMQKQRLVELLKRQLEHGSREGRVSEPLIFVRVKEEPPDKPSVAPSTGRLPPQVSSTSHELDVTRVAVKEEVLEEASSDTTVPSGSDTSLQPLSQTGLQEPMQLKPEQKNAHVCLKQSALQLAQQQAIQKLLLQRQQQQQQSIQKPQQTVQKPNQLPANQQNLHKLCQQKKKKLQKLQVRQQQEQEKASQSQQQLQHSKHLQQMQLKQQILLKQQKSLLQQHLKQQQQSKQLQQIQIQTKIHMKQQQIQMQQNQGQQQQQQQQQQQTQVSQAYFNQQSAFPLDLLKSDSTPTLVTDSNGNHFLIALTGHINGNQNGEASEGKVENHITPQTHNGGLQVSVDQPQQGAAQCLSAPPTLPPFFKDQDSAPLGKNSSSPSSQTDVCHSFDALFSPLSPASVKTVISSSDDKQDTEHEEDFIDTIMQTGEMPTTLNQTQEPSLHYMYPNSPAPSPIPSPLHQLLSPPFPPSRSDAPQADRSVQHGLPAPDFLKEEKQHLSHRGSGRLEDFLESTTGKPLLGVEPGGLLTVIDDLNSQMLCTPSILDHLPSPMDTFDMVAEDGQGLDNMDWLDFTMEKEKEEEMPTLAPLAPQTPPSVFSTDFLDSYDLYIHWDSCL